MSDDVQRIGYILFRVVVDFLKTSRNVQWPHRQMNRGSSIRQTLSTTLSVPHVPFARHVFP